MMAKKNFLTLLIALLSLSMNSCQVIEIEIGGNAGLEMIDPFQMMQEMEDMMNPMRKI
jgi:hypothetical protein